MTLTLMASLLSILATAGQTDTTFRVQPGTRLDVNNFGGEIVVSSWNRNAVRVEAVHSAHVQIQIDDSGSNLVVKALSRRGLPARVEYKITVPDWMPLNLSGVYTDVSVQGTHAEIEAETVKGDVSILGGGRFLKLSSIEGVVNVDGARGRLEVSSVNDAVSLKDIEGDVTVDAVNGDVMLDHVLGRVVQATTVNGDVNFLGRILDGGTYQFSSHNGDLTLAVPERTDATVSVSTFSGDFASAFAVKLSETRRDKRFTFVLGSGSAKIDLETFDGTIHLRHATGLEMADRLLRRKMRLLKRQEMRMQAKDENLKDKEK